MGDQDPPPLRAHLLGSVRLALGDRPLPDRVWPRKSARRLLLLLATADHRLARAKAQDLLWPERAPTSAANALNLAVSALRRVLEPGLSAGGGSRYLASDAEELGLRPTARPWVDAAAFEALVAAAERGAADDRRAALREALDLYGGDLLGAEAAADWAAPRRAQLAADRRRVGDRVRRHRRRGRRCLARERRSPRRRSRDRAGAVAGDDRRLDLDLVPPDERRAGPRRWGRSGRARSGDGGRALAPLGPALSAGGGRERGPRWLGLAARHSRADPGRSTAGANAGGPGIAGAVRGGEPMGTGPRLARRAAVALPGRAELLAGARRRIVPRRAAGAATPVVTPAGELLALDPATGAERWRVAPRGLALRLLAVGDGPALRRRQ